MKYDEKDFLKWRGVSSWGEELSVRGDWIYYVYVLYLVLLCSERPLGTRNSEGGGGN